MADISIPAALAALPPPEGASAKTRELWDRLQVKISDLSDVSSHSEESASYSRDLMMAKEILLYYWQAYLNALAADGALAGTDPRLLSTGRSRGVDFSAIQLHDL